MKVTELMIGNWVYRKRKPMQIIWIHENSVKLDCGNGLIGEAIDLIEPIPLTPEKLEKNGFVNDFYEDENVADYAVVRNEGYSLHCKADGFDDALITWCNGHLNIVTDFNGEIKKDINYVHELQNALTLCKIEKQIKP